MRSTEDESIKELQNKFVKMTVDFSCPACSQNSWIMDGSDSIYIPSTRSFFEDRTLPSIRHESYVIYCSNCGFIAQFLKSIVDAAHTDAAAENQSE